MSCAIACGSPEPKATAGATTSPAAKGSSIEGALVTVTFVDAVIALSHDDGLAWDSPHVVPELVRAGLRVARTRPDGWARVNEAIAARDGEPWGKPDPVGSVTLMPSPSCNREMRLLPAQRDTYRPSWTPGMTWEHVPLDRGTRFRIVLEDDDAPRPNELIGAVDITYAALTAALAAEGAVMRVDVGDQGQPIYFVGLRVVREP
ncbi:MAG: uncharacterized protein JWP87_1266 [Labilithrix sp.]|nr:uncharacterized protein [Labilithrix sp.]